MSRYLRWRDCLAAAGAHAARAFIRSARWTVSSSHRLVCIFEPWGIVFTLAGVVIALITITVELDDRQAERTFRAWQFLAASVEGGSAQRGALEYLNREFDGFLCSGSVTRISRLLTGNSRRRCLFPAKERESLSNVDVRSDLTGADLTGAILTNARLDEADLTGADLTGADLTGTFFTGTDLTNADLTNADLRDARQLTQEQLNAACGDSAPLHIPNGLQWTSQRCPEQ